MRQTLVALADVLTPGSWGPTRPAPNLTYADLLELRELAHDVLLHRDTSERLKHPIFQELSIFAKDSTSPFSDAFRYWGPRYAVWKEASARNWGLCRTPTETDFLRQTMEGMEGDPKNHHPFYSCRAGNHEPLTALWKLGDCGWHAFLLPVGRCLSSLRGCAPRHPALSP